MAHMSSSLNSSKRRGSIMGDTVDGGNLAQPYVPKVLVVTIV